MQVILGIKILHVFLFEARRLKFFTRPECIFKDAPGLHIFQLCPDYRPTPSHLDMLKVYNLKRVSLVYYFCTLPEFTCAKQQTPPLFYYFKLSAEAC